jgi:hypothetical protein
MNTSSSLTIYTFFNNAVNIWYQLSTFRKVEGKKLMSAGIAKDGYYQKLIGLAINRI